jgi:hypothetical protein
MLKVKAQLYRRAVGINITQNSINTLHLIIIYPDVPIINASPEQLTEAVSCAGLKRN